MTARLPIASAAKTHVRIVEGSESMLGKSMLGESTLGEGARRPTYAGFRFAALSRARPGSDGSDMIEAVPDELIHIASIRGRGHKRGSQDYTARGQQR